MWLLTISLDRTIRLSFLLSNDENAGDAYTIAFCEPRNADMTNFPRLNSTASSWTHTMCSPTIRHQYRYALSDFERRQELKGTENNPRRWLRMLALSLDESKRILDANCGIHPISPSWSVIARGAGTVPHPFVELKY
jgi:hypothetical protein